MSFVRFTPNFPSLVENFLKNEEYHNSRSNNFDSLPKVNVFENKENFILEVAAPGLKKENFKLKVIEQRLIISADQEINTNETDGENNIQYIRKEYNYNKFQRSFSLPKSVDLEQIAAVYLDGILSITLHKKEEAKAKEPLEIEVL